MSKATREMQHRLNAQTALAVTQRAYGEACASGKNVEAARAAMKDAVLRLVEAAREEGRCVPIPVRIVG